MKGDDLVDDRDIIELFWNRDSKAIATTEEKYNNYCRTIIQRILVTKDDIDECLNDVHLKLWNSIPPNHPKNFRAYLAKIARNTAFDRYKKACAGKRGGGEISLVLDELSEITSQNSVEDALNKKELTSAINDFLSSLSKNSRDIFICRYWYALTIPEISHKFGKTQNNISVSLNRTREKLKVYLTERGFII